MIKKVTKLDDVQQFYVKQNPENLSEQELADKFNCDVKLISQYFTPTTKEVKSKDTAFNKARRIKVRNGKPTATVMTQSASSIADNASKTTTNFKDNKNIHRPYGDEN